MASTPLELADMHCAVLADELEESAKIIASQEKKIDRMEVMVATRDQQIGNLQRILKETE
jgi:hypothetical protein